MAESALNLVPAFLAVTVLVIAASSVSGQGTQTGTNCEDVHMITFVNSNTENAVDIYVTSGSSTSFEQDKLDGQQLSERCAYSPDCAKLLNSEQSRGSDVTQSVITLPLQNGIALLDYRCSNDVLTHMATGTFDTGCSATTVFTTDNGGGPYFVCLTTDEIFVYEVLIDYDSVEDSNLIEVMAIPGVNTSAASLSNFLYTFEENFDLIVYGSGNNIATVQLPIGTFQQAGVLTNCSKVERLERVRGPNSSTWARCNDGTTKSFDVQMLGDSIRTVTSSGLFRFICPDSNVFMEIDLDNSFIKYGLEDTFQTFSLPGSKFRPDLSICFEVNNVILLAFVDEDEGVYVFDSSVFTVTKLFELQACLSEPSLCRQLLLFCDRYLHVREPDGNSLIDMQSLEVIIDHQFIPVEFAATITCPSESPSSDSNDDYIAYIIVGAALLLVLIIIIIILILVACTVCYIRHRRGHMDVLGNAADNRPLTIGQTSLDTGQGSLPFLPPSGDGGHIYQGSGRPRPTETTFIQAAGDAPISNEVHSQHQDNSQTQTYDTSPPQEDRKQYPPRFRIRVNAGEANETHVTFTFSGAKDLYFEQHPGLGVSASRSMPDISHPKRSLLPGDEGYLNKQCTEKHLAELSLHIPDWEDIVDFLGFQSSVTVIVSDIKNRYPHDQRLQTKQMFREWRVCRGKAATYSYLIGVFEKLQKMDYADILRDIVDEDCSPMTKRPRNDD